LAYAICILFIVLQWLKQQEGKEFPKRDVDEEAHIFSGMMIALSGQMSRSHVMPLNVLTDPTCPLSFMSLTSLMPEYG
jgi:hypothetical protein